MLINSRIEQSGGKTMKMTKEITEKSYIIYNEEYDDDITYTVSLPYVSSIEEILDTANYTYPKRFLLCEVSIEDTISHLYDCAKLIFRFDSDQDSIYVAFEEFEFEEFEEYYDRDIMEGVFESVKSYFMDMFKLNVIIEK